ncbi:MAG: sensor histidine kinase [Candidatus Electronema sp. V4]|uniref:sensor histidine kinase n=1 Tax=Candidatus Electronema sp. V4 TaxID=3454756 RepID=UPI0040554766
MMTHDCPDLQKMCQRVREKSVSYEQYNFTCYFDDFLKAFFDLAQEYDSLGDFYRICVAVPLEMLGVFSALYIYDEKDQELRLVCDCQEGVQLRKVAAPEHIILSDEPYRSGESYVMPIWSKAQPETELPPEEGRAEKMPQCALTGRLHGKNRLLGMYSVSPFAKLSQNDLFFFSKYTNRIGYSLHNRLTAIQNIEHLKFINTLVMDIEHNVIVPNMYFRHLFNKLKRNIAELDGLREDIRQAAASGAADAAEACLARCAALQEGLMFHHGELVKHHQNISLFLESLFRREHFESGRLVLHPKRCFVEKEIILPQLEHYDSRFHSASITVERPGNMLDEEFQLVVDIGLLSQVYANLFSNAAKYTREIITQDGRLRKAVAYGREIVSDFLECGEKGVKFNVFSTGPHLDKQEARHIFQEGVRGKDTEGIHGTGHGLSFVQHVVELHGGIVGYERTPEGNNFYFILPVVAADE